jgi:predicted nucleic acid-binding Zn ribbon protein
VPLYRFRCPACGHEHERTIPIEHYDTTGAEQRCACGGLMVRAFDPPLIVATSGRWREQVASIGPSEFMRREQRTPPGGE